MIEEYKDTFISQRDIYIYIYNCKQRMFEREKNAYQVTCKHFLIILYVSTDDVYALRQPHSA